MFDKLLAPIGAIALTACATGSAQTATGGQPLTAAEWAEGCEPWDEWDKPAPPFKIHGDTYYVGTCGIAAILVADRRGHFLIDSGTEAGAEIVLANIRSLGFDPKDIRFISHSHEHYDHVGGFAVLAEETGAQIVASPIAKEVLESGVLNEADPQFGMHDPMKPVTVARIIEDREQLDIGWKTFTAIGTPGHSPGALSWQWKSCEEKDCLSIVYADSLSPVSRDDFLFSDPPGYVAAYRTSLLRIAHAECDMLLTPHPSASQMLKRAASGSLKGWLSCKDYAARVSERLDQRMLQESAR
ncbi:MAG: subclass B3 metallo-beta-lactamase [Erythrobacter sp.]|nr:subclass B3 metallo-beta-lactamase [Erythrobacter sp.]